MTTISVAITKVPVFLQKNPGAVDWHHEFETSGRITYQDAYCSKIMAWLKIDLTTLPVFAIENPKVLVKYALTSGSRWYSRGYIGNSRIRFWIPDNTTVNQ